ncbi:MAG: hypothetical protein EPO24_12325 [Bacteroidetes bacterium]|nr:MAG: hypothetical protein EPO24_12325 [Bacteroidota bacterium]
MKGNKESRDTIKVYDACPHCGRELSPWEKVLLGVDRALMCKHCWYRIILDINNEEKQAGDTAGEKGKSL